jgi:hypothetical protein
MRVLTCELVAPLASPTLQRSLRIWVGMAIAVVMRDSEGEGPTLMNKMLWLAIITMLCTTTTGCMFDYLTDWDDDDTYYDDYEDPYAYSEATVEIDDAYLAGDLGNYEGFVEPAYETSGNTYGDNTTVEIHGGEDYWVMTRLEIQGSLQHRDLAPGAHLEFDNSTYGWDDSGEPQLFVSVVGCSGPSHGDWDYDSTAGRVVVDVEQGPTPNDRVVHFQADYDYEGTVQVLDGSFGYTVY